jgi:hypothetical protein
MLRVFESAGRHQRAKYGGRKTEVGETYNHPSEHHEELSDSSESKPHKIPLYRLSCPT